MIEACQKIGRLISVSRADFDASEEKQLALERLLEIVGEAAAKVSEEFKSLHPFVPWRQAIAMRNFVILVMDKIRVVWYNTRYEV